MAACAVAGGDGADDAIETPPVQKPTEVSGLFKGHLEFETNKSSFDCEVDLYALNRAGQYFALAPWWSRVHGRSVDFEAMRLMSHLLQPGDRVVAVVRVVKDLGRQINYGSARDVSDQSLAKDAATPLRVTFRATSHLDLPIARSR